MLKYLLLTLACIAGALLWIVYGIGAPNIYSESLSPEILTAHIYDTPERRINEIDITAVYFVPKDRAGSAVDNWHEILERSLEQLQAFHGLQFRGASNISYRVYDETLIGAHDSFFYDTADTSRGNPHALIAVAEEIEELGVLVRPQNGAYPVLFIMYEGVGASGGIIYESDEESEQAIAAEVGIPEETVFIVDVESVDGFFLINRVFADADSSSVNESILVHEFYHTLGVPDRYVAIDTKSIPTSQDIMGLGRFQPLNQTYLGGEVLEHMGL